MRICMVVYAFYEFDSRVMMYCKALLERGDRVDVISLRKDGQAYSEVLNGARVYRIQKRNYDERGRLCYLFRIIKFLILSFLFLTIKHLEKPYDVIHVHSIPDFEVFAALIPKLVRRKIILDIHDLVPEFYISKFKSKKASLFFNLLVWAEKASTAFSDHVIVANHLWKRTLVSRSVPKNKCTAILNYPDLTIFCAKRQERHPGKFIIIYPGTLNRHQGVDVAIKAINIIREKAPEAEFHIYGEGGEKKALMDLVSTLKLEKIVFFNNFLPANEIASVIASADLGVVPKRASSFGNEAFSTKILEFMALSVPVIVSDTKIDRYYFQDSVIQFFRSDDENDLARCMLSLIRDREKRERLVANASKFIENCTWEKRKDDYLKLVDTLTENSRNKIYRV